jgi:hypothetical protein
VGETQVVCLFCRPRLLCCLSPVCSFARLLRVLRVQGSLLTHTALPSLPPALYGFPCAAPQAFAGAVAQGSLWRHDADWAVFNTGLRRADDGSPLLLFLSRRTWAPSSGYGCTAVGVTAPWVASSKVGVHGPVHVHVCRH